MRRRVLSGDVHYSYSKSQEALDSAIGEAIVTEMIELAKFDLFVPKKYGVPLVAGPSPLCGDLRDLRRENTHRSKIPKIPGRGLEGQKKGTLLNDTR